VDTFLAIASRREVRDYESRTLPPEVEERILDAGRLAGSSKNRQPWRFHVVPGELLVDAVYEPTNLRGAPFVVATEGYAPNIPVAAARLKTVGVPLIGVESAPDNVDQDGATPNDTASHLPFRDDAFDLVLNRHSSYWPSEVARVLEAGGTYLTQQRGDGDGDLLRAFGRPTPEGPDFDLSFAVEQLEEAGFEISRAEESVAIVRFFDVGALVYYLRAIPWIVPDFDVDADRAALHRIHGTIEAEGSFGVGSGRMLIEARTVR